MQTIKYSDENEIGEAVMNDLDDPKIDPTTDLLATKSDLSIVKINTDAFTYTTN